MADETAGLGPDEAPFQRQRWLLPLLVLVLTASYVDRTIIAILGPAIRADLGISDAQIGILSGLAFGLLYTMLGIPFARLAERTNRVTLITVTMSVWSAFTALSGAASNFTHLLMARVGVGVGEAGCLPSAHSLIADSTPPEKRATAISIFQLGQSLGALFGAVAGGFIAQRFGWRAAFVIVGLPGLLIALVFRLVLREPPRGTFDVGGRAAAKLAPPPFSAVVKRVASNGASRNTLIGSTIAAIASFGLAQFVPAYFLRVQGLTLGQTGLIVGLTAGIAGGIGTVCGGLFTDAAGRSNRAWYAWIPAIGFFVGGLSYAGMFLPETMTVPIAAALLALGMFSVFLNPGPTFAIMHGAVDPKMRASATAIVSLCVYLIGFTVGPFLAGYLIDHFAAGAFTGADSFQALCRGADAAKEGAVFEACTAAQAEGTRHSLSIVWVFYVWAAIHYGIAGLHLARQRAQLPAATAETEFTQEAG